MKSPVLQTISAGFVVAVTLWATSASATPSSFDSLATPDNSANPAWGGGNPFRGVVPSPFETYTWNDWGVMKADGGADSYQTVFNNTYFPPSLPNFGYNLGGSLTATISRAAAFNFDGAWFTSMGVNNAYTTWSSHNLRIEGYQGGLGGTKVGDITFALSPSAFVYQPVGFTGIDTLVFTSDGAGKYWGMDQVPDGGTTAMLLGVAMLGLGWVRRAVK